MVRKLLLGREALLEDQAAIGESGPDPKADLQCIWRAHLPQCAFFVLFNRYA
jgi:hypothetical protein